LNKKVHFFFLEFEVRGRNFHLCIFNFEKEENRVTNPHVAVFLFSIFKVVMEYNGDQ